MSRRLPATGFRLPEDEKNQTWRPPTRRTFVAMLAAAAIALKTKRNAEPPPLPKWIGHA